LLFLILGIYSTRGLNFNNAFKKFNPKVNRNLSNSETDLLFIQFIFDRIGLLSLNSTLRIRLLKLIFFKKEEKNYYSELSLASFLIQSIANLSISSLTSISG
jgi:hypothetical protein